MRLVLDHASQGFLSIDLGGQLARDRSATLDRWFGEPAPDVTIVEYLSAHSDELAVQFARGLAGLSDGLPVETSLAQLPNRLSTDAHAFDLHYAPLLRDGKPERILVIITDVTEQVARERELRKQREQRAQREIVALSQLVSGDRASFDEFFAEAAGLVASLDAPSDAETERRTLRTLKDSCAYYGVETYVELCQEIETSIATTASPMTDEQRVALANGWGKIASQLAGQMA
jgi:hypothetical protein